MRIFRNSILSSTFLLGACAIPMQMQTTVTETPLASARNMTKSPIKDCAWLIRDLSVDWSLRHYWCGASRTSSQGEKNKAMLAAIDRTKLRLAALRDRTNTIARRSDDVVKKITPHLKQRRAKTKMVSHETTDQKNSAQKAHRIVFAQGREHLGPQGRSQTLDLIQTINNARQVTLRGRLTAGEFPLGNALDAERRSVGRSLSVRELWLSSGVNVDVTILHHSPDLSGTFVEVTVHE